MTRTTVTTTVEIELTVAMAAQWFCGLDDEAQADFFVAVQRESMAWDGVPDSQWWYMAKHLATCKCSNRETRDMIRFWAETLGEESNSSLTPAPQDEGRSPSAPPAPADQNPHPPILTREDPMTRFAWCLYQTFSLAALAGCVWLLIIWIVPA